jgi:hypothetical protein
LRHIENPSEEAVLAAIKKDPYSILHLKSLSKKVQEALGIPKEIDIYSKDITEEEMIILVDINPYLLKFLNNASIKVQLRAIKKDPFSIECLENPSELVQIVALDRSFEVIGHIKNPCEAVLKILNGEEEIY